MAITEFDKRCANKVKILRKKHGIKQLSMAQYLALDGQQQYSDLENGKKHFSPEVMLKICDLFRISLLDLIDESGNDGNASVFLDPDDYKLLEKSDNQIKSMVYKKLFLESKIENIEIRLTSFYTDRNLKRINPSKHKLYVFI